MRNEGVHQLARTILVDSIRVHQFEALINLTRQGIARHSKFPQREMVLAYVYPTVHTKPYVLAILAVWSMTSNADFRATGIAHSA